MKKFLLASTLLCLATLLYSQSDLYSFNENRITKQKRAMTVLGTWAIGNMAVGVGLQGSREGSEKYFHQMNILKGIIAHDSTKKSHPCDPAPVQDAT